MFFRTSRGYFANNIENLFEDNGLENNIHIIDTKGPSKTKEEIEKTNKHIKGGRASESDNIFLKLHHKTIYTD